MFNQTCCGEEKQKPMRKQKFVFLQHNFPLLTSSSGPVRGDVRSKKMFFSSFLCFFFDYSSNINPPSSRCLLFYPTPHCVVRKSRENSLSSFTILLLYILISRCNENRSMLDSRRTWNLNTPSRQPWKEYILSINRWNEYIIRSYLCMRMDIEMTSFELWKSRLNSCWCHHLFHLLTQFHSFMVLLAMVVETDDEKLKLMRALAMWMWFQWNEERSLERFAQFHRKLSFIQFNIVSFGL